MYGCTFAVRGDVFVGTNVDQEYGDVFRIVSTVDVVSAVVREIGLEEVLVGALADLFSKRMRFRERELPL